MSEETEQELRHALAEATERCRWLEGAAEIGSSLLGASDPEAELRLVAERARQVARAELAVVLLRTPGDALVVELCHPEGDAVPPGTPVPLAATLCGQVVDLGEPIVVDETRAGVEIRSDLGDAATSAAAGGPTLLLPLGRRGDVRGVLAIVRARGSAPFTARDVPLAGTLATAAAFALDRARAQADRAALAVLEDRDRIARDLHDLVIQRLFATGLSLQGLARSAEPAQRARLDAAVDNLDETIRDIRTTIFQLHRRPDSADVRGRLHDVLDEAARPLGFAVPASIRGPVESLPDELAEDLVAVLRESLSNVARHAEASHVCVDLAVGDALVLTVTDDGGGFVGDARGSGVRNMRARARRHGGTLRICAAMPAGTRLEWQVPMTRPLERSNEVR